MRGRLEDLAATVPESLQQMIEQQEGRLAPEERQTLEVASVAGAEFSAAAVAAGLGREPDKVEEPCTQLARRGQFLRASGTSEWPDGTIATCYSFQHALYQEVLYARLPAGRRQRLHQQIGEREEQGYGERAGEIAAELALHFEQGREYRKAIHYLQQAGESTIRQSAHQEALSLLTKGLDLLKTLPDTPERNQQELTLLISLGAPMQAIKGPMAPEVERVYSRARELCHQVGESPQLFPALWGLWWFHLTRAEYRVARELAEQLYTLAQSRNDSALLLEAHHAGWTTSFFLGELVLAREHAERGVALYSL